MTGQEIAEWFNIKYATYRCKTKSYLEKLKMFCKFKQYRGYIEIEEIFVAKYDKKLNRQLESLFLNEVYENPLTTVVGFSNKYQVSKYQTTQVRNKMFGTTPAKLGMREEGGTAGANSWKIVLRNFQEEIGHPIARVDKYSVNFYKTEEEYLKDLLNKQNREYYDIFPQVYDDTKNNEVYDF